jgi:alkanesulfonate monooxygenase SsuD/methylene tetrahydromethanopterin reductase-like flavin-dependent oxidoreductase (luciferase family)
MSVPLPVAEKPRFGATASAADGPRGRSAVEAIRRWGYEAIWTGDHVAFTGPINDPLTQLAYFSAVAPEMVFGTCVYLLPLRHPVLVAKMVATVDRLLGAGHLIFGVGVGGEFPPEYEACGIPLKERGGRMNESIALMRRLWSEPKVAHRGRHFSFGEIRMQPPPLTPGGPPIWVGGRAEAALKRAARLGDGWMPYVVAPKRYSDGLTFIAAEAERAGRKLERFGTGLLLFTTLGETYESALDVAAEHLSKRYAMDFREPARRYCALGRPADVAAKVAEFIRAGAREFIIDMIGPNAERDEQMERFAREVIPLVANA